WSRPPGCRSPPHWGPGRPSRRARTSSARSASCA
ncbi:MAG: hypothetical protein AVDCRST_MAG80-2571, partial [uncultured Rubrobacteraceae bacterium]